MAAEMKPTHTDVADLALRMRSLGLHVVECAGHDLDALGLALTRTADRSTVVLARTVKGKGVPFMEGDDTWHSGNFSATQLAAALRAVDER